MAQVNFAIPGGGKPPVPTLGRPIVAQWRFLLCGWLARLALLTAGGMLAGLLLGGVLAWFVGSRIESLVAEQAAAGAADEVALGIASRVTASDFEAPATSAKRDDLRTRLAPVISQVRSNGSEVIGIELVARDGTLVYTDTAAASGSAMPAAERPLLVSALAGKRGWLSTAPGDASLELLYARALFVSVPVERDGSIIGAYIVEQHVGAIDSLRLLVWAVVAMGFGLTLHAMPRATVATVQQQPVTHGRNVKPTPDTACRVQHEQEHCLTPREWEVLRLLPSTLTYQQIACELSVSEETVRTHVKSVLNKLGQPNRTQAVLVALKTGLLEML